MTQNDARTATTQALRLGHSGDPDDAFMWWPITGKVRPDGSPWPGKDGMPAIDTSGLVFRAVPGDIEQFNRRAASTGDLEITALSARAWLAVRDRYIITRVGGSFGEGYGPKLVCRADDDDIGCFNCLKGADVRIAVPGTRTTAFMVMGLLLGPGAMSHRARFIELPFDQIIPAVVRGDVNAGLVIHEGQVSFADAGLRQVEDLGAWWGRTRGLPLPLGVNAVRRDLDRQWGAGTLSRVGELLHASLEHALAHRAEGVRATMPFAIENAARSGVPKPDEALVDRYISMYVTGLTRDMGDSGRQALERLFSEGAAAGLCEPAGAIDLL